MTAFSLLKIKNILKIGGNLCLKYNNNSISTNQLENGVVSKWTRKLESAKIEDVEFTIKCILAHVLNKKFNSTNPTEEYNLNTNQCEKFERLCECRLARMPLQYIIGEWDFCDLTLKMRPPVFIPRPETEKLVSLIIQNTDAKKPFRFVDVGCGSGAICLSLLKSLPKSECIALDRSKLACQLTEDNSKILGLQDRIKIYNHIVEEKSFFPECIKDNFDAIISNPPYVKTSDLMHLQPEIKLYENLNALDGGVDGLRVIRILLKMTEEKTYNGGKLWLELDSSQNQVVKEIVELEFKNNLRFVRSYKDIFQNERYVEIEKVSNTN